MIACSAGPKFLSGEQLMCALVYRHRNSHELSWFQHSDPHAAHCAQLRGVGGLNRYGGISLMFGTRL